MFFIIIGASLATAATTAIANPDASSTTISGKPSKPVPPTPPNREGSDEPNPSNTEGINQQGSLLT